MLYKLILELQIEILKFLNNGSQSKTLLYLDSAMPPLQLSDRWLIWLKAALRPKAIS